MKVDYNNRTFIPTICWSVCVCVCMFDRLHVCLFGALWQNGWLDMDVVWDVRSDRSKNEAGSLSLGIGSQKGITLGANVGCPIVTDGGVRSVAVWTCEALWCGCSVPMAEWLDLSALGIAAADESILYREGWQAASSKITLEFRYLLLLLLVTCQLNACLLFNSA